jgi:hypothetical protein
MTMPLSLAGSDHQQQLRHIGHQASSSIIECVFVRDTAFTASDAPSTYSITKKTIHATKVSHMPCV